MSQTFELDGSVDVPVLAQHCFIMCALPHLSQTVRCGTSRQLATDTCDGGFVRACHHRSVPSIRVVGDKGLPQGWAVSARLAPDL